jgi:ech hydrogenase subunit F
MIARLVKNLMSGPVTRRYPAEKRAPFPDARGSIELDLAKCDLCGDCARLCPSEALTSDEKKRVLTYNPYRCIYCRLCAESCLHQALVARLTPSPPADSQRNLVWEAVWKGKR